jgi:hypothetical protein
MMTTEGTYLAASRVAPRIRAYFEQHGAAERSGVPVPPEATIARIIDAAFWTSLRREEGYVPRISLAFVPVEAARDGIRFARPLPLLPAALARIAPAVERPGIHLAAWYGDSGGEPVVWGTVRRIATFTLVVEVAAPGLVVIKHHRGGERRKFVNVAVLEGDQVKVIDERASTLPDCPPLVTAMLGFDAPELWHTEPGVLVQLAVSMRAHGRGGLLLVVPDDGEQWRESVLQPVLYGIEPRYSGLAALLREPAARYDVSWEDARAHLVSAIGGLTAVDGATIMTRGYELLAFGAKVTRRRGAAPVPQVIVTEPVEGSAATVVDPGQLGGTRHVAAAQFVHDQRGSLALVASQDGRFTVFAWSPCEASVHAHRVETLLL